MKRSLLHLMLGIVCVVVSGSFGCDPEKERESDNNNPAEKVDRCETDNGGCGAVEFFSCTDGVDQEPTCVSLDVCATDNGGCGAAEYFSCTDGVGKAATCTALNVCATDNGGCGAEEYFLCTDGVGKAATCTALDMCATDNGGCGAAEYFSCTDGVGKAATCTALDMCATDNGGCGDPADFLCTDGEGKDATCTPLHACAEDNGGCGDRAEYTCYPGEGSEPVVCRFIGECVVEELIVEAEIAVSLAKDRGLITDELIVELRGQPGWYEDYAKASEIYLRFDLSAISAAMRFEKAILQMTSFTGYAMGNDGNVYINRIDNAWTVNDLSWDTRPAWLDDTPLGFWWAWYDRKINEVIRQVNTPALVDAVDAAVRDDKKLSLNLYSIGYRSEYRTLEDEDPAKRPQLVLWGRRCYQKLLTATENVSVAVNGANASDNSTLIVDGDRAETYLKFDLSSLHPAAKIVDANLMMVAFNGQGTGGDDEVFTTFIEDDSWSEASLSWDTRLTAESAYFGHWLLNYAAAPSSEVIEKAVSNDYFGLIPLVQREYDGDKSLSLRIDSPEAMSKYYGRTNNALEKQPALLVTYEVP